MGAAQQMGMGCESVTRLLSTRLLEQRAPTLALFELAADEDGSRAQAKQTAQTAERNSIEGPFLAYLLAR